MYDEIRRLAASYKNALINEFPQYHYQLTIHRHWTVLRIYKRCDDGCPINDLILTAEFLPRHIRIARKTAATWRPVGDLIDYADPRFTEDILSNILRAA